MEALAEFKTGLPTKSRRIKARAISAGKLTELEGPETWKVIDPHSLGELEHVRVELLLTSAERRSCELHVEFRSAHVLVNVSDSDTGWGRSVSEDTRSLLGNLGISPKVINDKLRKAYGLLDIFQNVLLMLSAAVFAVWRIGMGTRFLYASLALLVAGVMPVLTLVLLLRAAQEGADHPGNGCQEPGFPLDGSDRGAVLPDGRAAPGESADRPRLVKAAGHSPAPVQRSAAACATGRRASWVKSLI
ncbi:MAG: hypothetical protein ACREF4_14790 [Gammaproteobacteria bacterium]